MALSDVMGHPQRRLLCSVLLINAMILTAGCAGLGKGITEAIISRGQEEAQPLGCEIRGQAFTGLENYMFRQDALPPLGTFNGERPALKVLMVHGIGTHQPGYALELAENLAKAMDLDVTAENTKDLTLLSPSPEEFAAVPKYHPDPIDWPDELGTLRLYRYWNKAGTRELLFYELTWSPISEPEKTTLIYDSSGEYEYRRANINQQLKEFVNNYTVDPLIYAGNLREPIQASVGQSICWMFNTKWSDFPHGTAARCSDFASAGMDMEDDYVMMSHSLGSRIVLDALNRMAKLLTYLPDIEGIRKAWQEREIPIFMLSNQLPLLQLGRGPPEIANQTAEYCKPTGNHYAKRYFRETRFVAFSDPNDILSYGIPPSFEEEFIDSRICPRLINVLVNVAPAQDLFGLGELANPLAAHDGYKRDERVIALITRGIGTTAAAPVVKENCKWMETRPVEKAP
ncbi:hypothetical protein [Nitrosococcus watsonii]|uniref:Uncharacterized protein n=1 Tax=Nitrosococcus watsoni (strain C-113) TaxID=105559 RepID=D8K490_NITWC|nr:hypothetical protein [Nitrosococcus watsonii]ADJ27787.1 hypothetical protein Nwat_0840 [Nitrosococcus watsonii C-113]